MRSEVLSRLYGHHVDVLRVHGRVLVVAGTGRRRARRRRPRRRRRRPSRSSERRPCTGRSAAIVEPGFFSSQPCSSRRASARWSRSSPARVGVFTVDPRPVVRRRGARRHRRRRRIERVPGRDRRRCGGSSAIAVAAAGVMELIGIQRARGRDLATGIVLGAGFGLAALFLYLGTIHTAPPARPSRSCSARSSRSTRSILPLVARLRRDRARRSCSSLYRPLLLSSVSPELAAARGHPGPARSAASTCSRWRSRSRSRR